ncbi:hypothetical protein G7Z17_g8434 [Cylindrodendrum hubeiense]|uniref:Nephrocystin 3-like N-terminal domain-containing protein n=1 Tax=Cylindrodendrum hubeiense TaxID=595255 RepID=A0A9P5H215_9HYPO|nr:hypothetical protein G7Z17_g8434 [Cylindrodendrum hubeiense]
MVQSHIVQNASEGLGDVSDCSWADVLASMEATSHEYKAKAASDRLRTVQRNRTVATTLQSLAEMIPEQDGLSVLRFYALRAHPNDEQLRGFVENLYSTLRAEIPNLEAILLRKHKGSLTRRLLKQHPENEASTIDSSLETISRASSWVTMRVGTLANQMMVDNLKETKSVSQEMARTQAEMVKLLDSLDCIQVSQLEMEQKSIARYERHEQLIHVFSEKVFQNMQHRLTASYDTHRRSTCLPDSSLSSSVTIPIDELYIMLRILDPFFLDADLGIVLRASNAIGQGALAQGAWLLNIDRFKAWAQIPNTSSDIILVEGRLDGLSIGKISPLSVLAATFTAMADAPYFVILMWFCGLHSIPRDHMSGCRGMLRSFIAQLIFYQRRQHGNVAMCVTEMLLEGVAHMELSALCELFRVFLGHVSPNVTVYCVVDNICEFETESEGWENELCQVVHLLQSMVSQSAWGPTLKVLLTTANRSIKVYRQMKPEDCISLSAGNRNARSTQRLSIEKDWQQAMSSR